MRINGFQIVRYEMIYFLKPRMNNIGFLHKSYASKNELSRKAKATEAI